MSSESTWQGIALWSTTDSGFKCLGLLDFLALMATTAGVYVCVKCTNICFVRPSYGAAWNMACEVLHGEHHGVLAELCTVCSTSNNIHSNPENQNLKLNNAGSVAACEAEFDGHLSVLDWNHCKWKSAGWWWDVTHLEIRLHKNHETLKLCIKQSYEYILFIGL